MTPLRTSIAATAVSVILLLVVFELIRSRRLRERYALLWLLTAFVMLVFSLWRGGLGRVASTIGVAYPPTALLAIASLFMLLVLLHYSTVISRLSDQNVVLAQKLALLEARLNESERKP